MSTDKHTQTRPLAWTMPIFNLDLHFDLNLTSVKSRDCTFYSWDAILVTETHTRTQEVKTIPVLHLRLVTTDVYIVVSHAEAVYVRTLVQFRRNYSNLWWTPYDILWIKCPVSMPSSHAGIYISLMCNIKLIFIKTYVCLSK